MNSRWSKIDVGNNSKVEVKEIGTCKLDMCGGQTLYLYDVLYVPAIHWNLVFVIMLIKLGFNVVIHFDGVNLYLEQIKYGIEYFLYGFIVMDIKLSPNMFFFIYAFFWFIKWVKYIVW